MDQEKVFFFFEQLTYCELSPCPCEAARGCLSDIPGLLLLCFQRANTTSGSIIRLFAQFEKKSQRRYIFRQRVWKHLALNANDQKITARRYSRYLRPFCCCPRNWDLSDYKIGDISHLQRSSFCFAIYYSPLIGFSKTTYLVVQQGHGEFIGVSFAIEEESNGRFD